MTKPKLVTFTKATSKVRPPTIITQNKNVGVYFYLNDFSHGIMLVILLHIKTSIIRLGGTLFNMPKSITTKHFHTLPHHFA
jgi:hypothetical protein